MPSQKETRMDRLTFSSRACRYAGVFGVGLLMSCGGVSSDIESTEQAASSVILPRNGTYFGKTYEQWAASWWQYKLSRPVVSNPLIYTSGADCSTGQSGPVWFLGGACQSGN